MKLDYVDIFYHHRRDPKTPMEESMMALDQAVKSGKALYAGISNYDKESTAEAAAILRELKCPFVINQRRYSIFDRTIEEDGVKSYAAENGIGIIAFSPLAQGMLTTKYLHGIPADSRIRTDGRFLKESDITESRLQQIKELNELANSILISVDNNDPAKGEQLQEKLTEKVNELLESDGFFGAVLGQTIRENGNLQQLAEQYGITQGKAQLIQQILDSTTGHTFEELAPLTINELNLIISTGTSSVEKVSSLGYASDKAYIGEDKAKETAFAHAGVSGQDILFYEMDMDLEKGVMVYEIEFKCGGFEYEYDIDAQTGEIIKNKKEVDDDFPAGSQASSGKTDDPDAGSQSPAPGTKTPDAGSQTPASGTNTPAAGTQSPGGNTATPPSSPQDGVGNAGGTSGILTLEQAKEIALNHAGQSASNVYFDKVELDHDHGMQKYEIEFIAGSTEYDYEIDAVTGAILKYDWDQDDDHMHISESSGNGAGGAVGTITSEQAKEIALNHAGQSASGVYFDKVDLDYDDGIQKYEVEFVSGNMEYDYEIDAITGAILKYDWDQD